MIKKKIIDKKKTKSICETLYIPYSTRLNKAVFGEKVKVELHLQWSIYTCQILSLKIQML